jgi:hypothetical protein
MRDRTGGVVGLLPNAGSGADGASARPARTGHSPKEIARALRLPPATIAPLVRAIAAQQAPDVPALVLAGCWVSAGWARGLTVHGHPDWPGIDVPAGPDDLGPSGLVTVLVAVERGGSAIPGTEGQVGIPASDGA